MHRRFFVLGAPLALAACAAEPVWAPDDLVQRMRYRHDGPPRLTLLTMRNVGSGKGAHSALMINAHERVIWDPAGSFKHPSIPERNDVIIGVTPQIEQYYISYHSRETFYTEIQEVDVPFEVAEQALQLAYDYGAVPKTQCSIATGRILQQLPGFEFIRPVMFPEKLAAQFAEVPGVRTREYRENDSDNNSGVLHEIVVNPQR